MTSPVDNPGLIDKEEDLNSGVGFPGLGLALVTFISLRGPYSESRPIGARRQRNLLLKCKVNRILDIKCHRPQRLGSPVVFMPCQCEQIMVLSFYIVRKNIDIKELS